MGRKMRLDRATLIGKECVKFVQGESGPNS
jgi:hypothetical protein